MPVANPKRVDASLFGALLFPLLPMLYFISLAKGFLPRPFGGPSLSNLIEVFVIGAFSIAACIVVDVSRRRARLLSARSLTLFVVTCYFIAASVQMAMPSLPE